MITLIKKVVIQERIKHCPPQTFYTITDPAVTPLSPRVLLRVRMLYYLRQEVIGDQAEKVLGGAIAR